MKQILPFVLIYFIVSLGACAQDKKENASSGSKVQVAADTTKVIKTEAEWKAALTPEQYEVTRMKETKRAFTGKYWDNKAKGKYYCVACNNFLFYSDVKFESSCGWPSFYQASNEN